MTHGVTGHTAKLLPMDESGALDEAFSDFFGKKIEDQGSWVMGKDLFIGKAKKDYETSPTPGLLS
jgi:Zn-dependent metalloprotease